MRRLWDEVRSSGLFLAPGISLLMGFGILPICLAVYMSLHRWKPVQGRFLGNSHYEKALGDITSALIVLAAFATLIVGVWLLTRDWRQTLQKRTLILVVTVGVVLFAAVLFFGKHFTKKPLLKTFFQNSLNLKDEGWEKLNYRWIGFFIFVAVLNEIVWRTQSESFWVNFKVWGLLPVSFIFVASQLPLIKKYKLK